MLITFSGLDGAGKTTLIESVRSILEDQNKTVSVLHMNKDIGVYATFGRLSDLTLRVRRAGKEMSPWRSPENTAGHPAGRRMTSGRRRMIARLKRCLLWNRPIRLFIYLVDLLIFVGYRTYLEKVKRHVLIMDRYFYDRLVDVADGRSWSLLRLLARLTPTPALPVLVDVSAEKAFARKAEYPVEYLQRRRAAYQTVFPWVRSAVVLTNDDLNATRSALARTLQERFRER